MDLKALRYFAAAAQFGSITRAAAHLNVAQPAVSRQIRKLESELGVPLMTRTPHGTSLSEHGQQLLTRAEPMLQIVNQIRSEVGNRDKEPSGPVSVALMPAVGSLVAPRLVERLREQHPKIQLRLSEGLSAFIAEGVTGGKFDLGLFHADQVPSNLSIVHLLDEPMFLIGPGDDRTRRAVDIKKLSKYPLLLPGQPNSLRRMIDRLADRHGITLDIRESVDSTSIIKRLVMAGLGYTVQCYSFVHEEVQRGDVSIRRLNVRELSRNWSLATRADRPVTAAVLAVASSIREISDELARTHHWYPPGS